MQTFRDPEMVKMYQRMHPGATRRTLVNKRNADLATRALAEAVGDPLGSGRGPDALLARWPWLLEGIDAARTKRETILYALGTLPDHCIPEVADILEHSRPRVQDAVRMIRRMRANLEGRQVTTAADEAQAARTLWTALAELRAQYPDTTDETVAAAAREMAEMLTH